MSKKKVGIVGWRGMVGSVLMNRMTQENDFKQFESIYFSTSQAGQKAPNDSLLLDAHNINKLKKMDIILTCQGGDYTNEVYPKLREAGWSGYWIDAASSLRIKDSSILVLDPLNKDTIEQALIDGKKDFIGPNCTVSLMMLALAGLFKNNEIDWISSMTYQAASGAGAKNMVELLKQMKSLGHILDECPSQRILEIDKLALNCMKSTDFPTALFGAPLAGSLIPWIDGEVELGQTKEEWKGMVETNKILNTNDQVIVDGTCVRMAAMRCHSQGLTIKLNREIPLDEIESMLKDSHEWIELVDNNQTETINKLTPTYTTGTLKIPIGRLRKMKMGDTFLNAFTVGDQLLWGAAEPLRRVLKIILEQ